MIQRNVEFVDEQPEYRYLKQKNEIAEVYVYKKISEMKKEDDEKVYFYDMNIFKVNSNEVSEDDIKNNIDYWFNYEKIEYTVNERIDAIEDVINSMILGEI